MMPWINQENREQAVELIQKGEADIMVSHVEIEGFEVMRGYAL